MKVKDVINNYGKFYFNVLPPRDEKPTGSMIVNVLRAKADEMGTMPTEYEGNSPQASKLYPNHKYDRRQNDDVARDIIRKSKISLKGNRNADHEYELVADKNRHAQDTQSSAVYR